MISINSNTAALRAQGAIRKSESMMQMDSAGLSAGTGVSFSDATKMLGIGQAITNTQSGLALANVADGALALVTNLAQQIRTLAVQSASGTLGDDKRNTIQVEVSNLTAQIGSTLHGASFNGISLFDTLPLSDTSGASEAGASGSRITIQIGRNAGDAVNIDIPHISIDPGPAPRNKASAAGEEQPTTTVTGSADDGFQDSSKTIQNIDSFLKQVNGARAAIGASINRLNSVENLLENNSYTIAANLSDTDSLIFTSMTSGLAKDRILNDLATAMLAQANASKNLVRKLIETAE